MDIVTNCITFTLAAGEGSFLPPKAKPLVLSATDHMPYLALSKSPPLSTSFPVDAMLI